MTDPQLPHVDFLIVGQGLAGTAVAWRLLQRGQSFAIVDHPRPETASRVSAGLITPITGKRLVTADDYDGYWQSAVDFYRHVEQTLGQQVFAEHPMLRLFPDEKARESFLDASKTVPPSTVWGDNVQRWSGSLQSDGREQSGIRMQPAGRLNVARYLQQSAEYFQSLERLYHAELDLADISQQVTDQGEAADNRVTVPLEADGRLTAQRIILCTGSWVTRPFPLVPNNPSRGDLLEVKIERYTATEVVHRSVWIAPEADGRQTIGSTYDWKFLENQPSQAGRQQVLTGVRRMVSGDIRIVRHRGAVRPTMKDYQPVLGRSPDSSRLLILNGLGSKGALRAPRLAEQLVNHLLEKAPIPSELDVARLRPDKPDDRRPLTTRAQEQVAQVLQPGDLAIDATVGNGFDACFLARCVGAAGRVIGFDVQQQALDATARRLRAGGLNNVELRLAGHEQLAAEQDARPAAVMFNLGYLPRSDKSCITTAQTSTIAITAALRLLRVGGVLSVLCYRGHEGGPQEFAAVEQLLNRLPPGYDLQRQDSDPPKPASPVLFVVRKQIDEAES